MIRLDCSRISPYHSVSSLFEHTTAPLGLTGEAQTQPFFTLSMAGRCGLSTRLAISQLAVDRHPNG